MTRRLNDDGHEYRTQGDIATLILWRMAQDAHPRRRMFSFEADALGLDPVYERDKASAAFSLLIRRGMLRRVRRGEYRMTEAGLDAVRQMRAEGLSDRGEGNGKEG